MLYNIGTERVRKTEPNEKMKMESERHQEIRAKYKILKMGEESELDFSIDNRKEILDVAEYLFRKIRFYSKEDQKKILKVMKVMAECNDENF